MTPAPNSDSSPDGGLMRVPSRRISRLMDLVAELSLSMAETVRSPDLVGLDLPHFDGAVHRLGMIMREVQDTATEMRLVPVDEVFRRLRRMVRELERETGKTVTLRIEGEDTLIDKLVADRIYDPLLHDVRNAVDHGLEPAADRRAAGKSEAGEVLLSASQVGSEVRIVVADDGRGLNRAKILAKAREKGLFGPHEEPEPSRLWPVIFQPGFSTAESVSSLSGRGVGMDVLNTAMNALRGRITVDSTEGSGTQVRLFIPVSLAFLDCVILRRGPTLFAVPIETIAEIVQLDRGSMLRLSADGSEALRLRGGTMAVCRLEDFFSGLPVDGAAAGLAAIVQTDQGLAAIPVDEVLDRQQVVMKPMIGRLAQVRASYGCALLGTGEVAIVLDCARLCEEGKA